MYAKFVLKELKDIIKTVIKVASFISVRALKRFLSLDSLKMVYYSYFHSVMTYGLIFRGNSHHSNIIFRLQKRIIRIIVGIIEIILNMP